MDFIKSVIGVNGELKYDFGLRVLEVVSVEVVGVRELVIVIKYKILVFW